MTEETGREDARPGRQELVAELVELLDVQPLAERHFRGRRKRGGVGRVYGGQVVAQALAAASRTVASDRLVHSLHAYFLRGGSDDHEIDYRVEADFDGSSISNRRVIAMQQGQVIFNLAASFHVQEPGHFHQRPMPDVPPPEEMEDLHTLVEHHSGADGCAFPRMLRRGWPIEMRSTGIPHVVEQESLDPHLDL